MTQTTIHLLVTFDQNYIAPFRVMLYSAIQNTPHASFCIWLLHSGISDTALNDLELYCQSLDVTLHPLVVDRALFEHAPISKQYPQEIYYRLLAPHMLPEELERVLYIDPDILVINPLTPLWETDLGEFTFAAASHCGDTINAINRLRLSTQHDYFNSGVMLIDLVRAREQIKSEDIFRVVDQFGEALLLPDQDVFNHLYGSLTLPLDDSIWNYDARYYTDYFIRSGRVATLDWVMRHTVVLHFCGKKKPWKRSYTGRFAALYKNYIHQVNRRLPAQATEGAGAGETQSKVVALVQKVLQ